MIDNMEGKSVIVLGGAGFLGSHLCERLLARGDNVLCLDNLHTGCLDNLVSLEGNPEFEFIKWDIIERFSIDRDIHEIYNLACPASPVHYQEDPISTMKTCVLGTLNFLELALEKSATFFQASTSEVYGDPDVHPQHEEYWGNVNPRGPRSCYDEGKRAAEALIFDFHRFHGLNIKVVRIFNTYGPRMRPDDGRVVSNFIVQSLKQNDITIYGDGSQTRSFCYVDDLIDGFIAMMEVDSSIVGPINLGNQNEFTVGELASLVVSLTSSTSKIVMMPLPQDDPRKRRPDISKAQSMLKWNPKVELEAGLLKTIEYFRVQEIH